MLVVVDGAISKKILLKIKRYSNQTNELDIFSLTSDIKLLDRIICDLKNIGIQNINIIQTAELIDNQFTELRPAIVEWSHQLGMQQVYSKTLKQWFLLPGQNVSTWWFSHLAEKSTYLTDAFFKIAQVYAIKKQCEIKQYSSVFVILTDKELIDSLYSLSIAYPFKWYLFFIKTKNQYGFLANIRNFLTQKVIGGAVILGFIAWASLWIKACLARHGMKNLKNRTYDKDSLLFVSYFPNFDKKIAQENKFLNKYAGQLQDLMQENQLPITWLMIPVAFEGFSFKQTIQLARKFSEHSEKIFILHEFFTIKELLAGIVLWLRQIVISYFLLRNLNIKLCGSLDKFCLPILRKLWVSSFVAYSGAQNIFYVLTYQRVFKKITHIKKCLYYLEMQGWEKALNAAKKKIQPELKTIGYQHNAISRNYLHYFYHSQDVLQQGNNLDMPLPDYFASNGNLMNILLAESAFPNLTIVEAVRQLYLAKNMQLSKKFTPKPTVIVAGAYSYKETEKLIRFVLAANLSSKDINIIFKSHPLMPIEKIVDEQELAKHGELFKGDIADLFSNGWCVITNAGNVALEALAVGCEVVIPVFPDAMNMSPLISFENFYHRVADIKQLKKVLGEICGGYRLASVKEYQNFIHDYWNLNPALPAWKKLLIEP